MAVITTHYNPTDSEILRQTVHQFQKYCDRVGVKLFIAELSFEADGFELKPGRNCEVIQVQGDPDDERTGQEDRLLNLIVDQLPDEFASVAILKASVQFKETHWPSKVVALLEDHAVVRLGPEHPGHGWAVRRETLKQIGGVPVNGITRKVEEDFKDVGQVPVTLTECPDDATAVATTA